MGDFHFVVRHGLTGIVLVLSALCGQWIADPHYVAGYFAYFAKNPTLLPAVASAVVAAPLLGVLVQGVYTAFIYSRGRAFTDQARTDVAAHIKERMSQCTVAIMPDAVRDDYRRAFEQMPSDAPFVWLYHTDAPPHLIEWARRRRSYHYLGMNWAIAAGLGLLLGLSLPLVRQLDHWVQASGAVAGILVWIASNYWLATKMKRDVDSMELVWTCAQIYPGFRDILKRLPDEEQVDQGSGKVVITVDKAKVSIEGQG